MTQRLAGFEAAVTQACAFAASFDAAAIAQSQATLTRWFSTVAPTALTADEWAIVQRRLTQYRDLCSFLQRTLNQALCKASCIEGAGYAGGGGSVERATPLMRRYG